MTDPMAGVPPAPPGRTSIIPRPALELIGYVGAAAAVGATIVATDDERAAGAVGGIVVALVLVLVGHVSAETDPGLDRMRSVLWFIAVVAWGIAAGVMMDAIFDEKWLVFVTAVLIAGLGAALYARERRSLQLIAMSIPIFAAAAALLYMTKSQSYFGYSFDVPNLRWSGLITALLGAAWLAVGFADIVHPKRTMMVLGALAFLLGVNVLVGDTGSVYGLGASTGVGTSVALLIASVILVFVGDRAEVLAVIGIGIFGSLTSVTQLVSANVHGTGPALVVLVAGLLVVGGGLLLIKPFGDGRLLGRPAPPPPPPS